MLYQVIQGITLAPSLKHLVKHPPPRKRPLS